MEQETNRPETNVIEQILASAEQKIDSEEYEEALQILQFALRRPEFDVRVYEKCAFLLRMLERDKGAEMFENVVADVNDPEAFFSIGLRFGAGRIVRSGSWPFVPLRGTGS
ncbi:hypothetical protein [Effusibacillus dendaii]|nr:hypothetical protein [Effusibacillus dendaii]